MKWIPFLMFFLISLSARAQSLVIADVDDTLKLADVPSYTGAVSYALDGESHFLGMDSVLNFVMQDNSDAQLFYVSKAPEWLMKETHEYFILTAGFPAGTYIGRSEYPADQHKLIVIRDLIDKYHPQRVLFLGDNGEQDPEVYAQIASEYPTIVFTQYIHIVFTALDLWGPMSPMSADQIGFVTSVELANDLNARGWLSSDHLQWMLSEVLPKILKERPGKEEGAIAFPYFMNCHDIDWRWSIPGLDEKIRKVCHLKRPRPEPLPW